MKCPNCNTENAEGTRYCTECGAQLIQTPIATNTAEPTQSTPIRETPYYAAPTANGIASADGVVSVWAYLGLLILFAVPIIGWICAIIFCFAPQNKSVKHFAGAMLILKVLKTLFSILLAILISVAVKQTVSDIQSGKYNDAINDTISEIMEEYSINPDAIGQLIGGENGDLNGVLSGILGQSGTGSVDGADLSGILSGILSGKVSEEDLNDILADFENMESEAAEYENGEAEP